MIPSGEASWLQQALCCAPDLMAVSDECKVVKCKLGNVNRNVGRIALIAIGLIAVIIGGVFAGQGMNLIPGSFMTGNRMWLSIGLIVTSVGIILLVLGLHRTKTGRPSK
ncbi:hypothetical protein [Paeniglutamicibacter cryotolerans]|nr:hypothetical protein [Paeniglutamicibacter cryotolerans]